MRYVALAFALLIAPSVSQAADPVEFNRDIRPILADACFNCHGLDAKARKAKLRLDVPEGAFAKRDGGAAITPGDPNGSEVHTRIMSDDPDIVMPPPRSNKKLTPAQKETIRRWIAEGAKYQKHWSFEAVKRPAVPKVAAARTPIDAFLLTRLGAEGLTPRPEADRETLIRRVSFALTGLPPSIQEVDRFLADKSPAAYEAMVDRYLASPRYGEEMARHWLDVARYGDTHGLHLDNERLTWAYRDWVVQAFNANKPFDRFTIEQLAGDLLPNPTPDQLAATGFNRCNVTTGEGGSIDAEWVYRNAVDRTSTVAQAWLGLTAGCAVCHDHKYDPLSIKEYYSLYAFFLSAADPALDSNVRAPGPSVKLPTPAQQRALEGAIRAEADARKRLDESAARAAYTDPAEATPTPTKRSVRDVLFDDAFPQWASSHNTTRNAADWVTDPPFGAKSGRRVLRQSNSFFHEDAIQYRGRPILVPAEGVFEAWVRLDPLHPPLAITVQLGGGRKIRWGLEPPGEPPPGAGGLGERKGPLPAPGVWVKLEISTAELGLKSGQTVSSLTLQEYGGVVCWDAVALTGSTDPATDPLESFQVWWKRLGGKAPAELPASLRPTAIDGPDKKPAADMVAKLRAFYLANIVRSAEGELATRKTEWERARADREAAEDAIPGSMVFKDLGTPREAFIMLRGQYDKPGEKVVPGVPAVLPPLKLAKPVARPTRLDLANWLVAPENPLTARVAVNRLWQQLFGVGLVKTSADFGSQGDPPSHPELLDWLAAEFVRPGEPGQDQTAAGWDVKWIVKLIVMSEAFRQDSRLTPELLAKDPANRLLARGPRFRLDAEQLRDNALFVSGLLNTTVGGRGVMPYQPANIWEPVGYADSNTRYYLQDHGGALYRRSLYVFIKRTAPHPFLTNFDAPNREQLCTIRDRTNTPLQALQLMNDVQHFEAARVLAERVIAEGGKTTTERVTFLYRTVLARRPDADEVRIVSAAFQKQWDLYKADPTAAKKVVRAGESTPKALAADDETAAWTMIANLILNLDETIMRN
jgi:hypothetical protein